MFFFLFKYIILPITSLLVGPEQMAPKMIWNVNKLPRQDRWRVEELFTFQSGAWMRSCQDPQRQWWQSPPTKSHLVEPLPRCYPPAAPHLFLVCSLCFMHHHADMQLLAESQEMSCLSRSQRRWYSQKQAQEGHPQGCQARRWEDTRKPVCPLLTWPTFLHPGWPGWPPCSYRKLGLGSISVFYFFFSLKCSSLFLNRNWWKLLLFLFFLSMNWSDDNRVSSKL